MTTRIGVAVVGHGSWGRNHARVAVASTEVELVGVVDTDEDRLRADHVGSGTRRWTSLDAALADDRVQAVIVATPPATHAAITESALRSDRHVLVEKPAAMRLRDARSLAELARRRGLAYGVGHTFLYSPQIRAVADWMRMDAPGRPLVVRSERLGARYRQDCDVLWNLAPHDVSILMHLVAEPVVAVTARTHAFGHHGRSDIAKIDLQFSSGLRGEVYVAWRHPGKKRSLRVLGSDWSIRYRDDLEERRVVVELYGEVSSGTVADHRMEPLLVQLDEFARYCRSGVPCATGPQHILATTAVLCAAERSAARGGTLERVDEQRSPSLLSSIPGGAR